MRRGMRTAVLLVAALTACSNVPADPEVLTMQLTSSSFDEAQPIPSEHTCDGADTSPPLAWTNVPEDAAAFALTVGDPDARDFVHWVLTDIPGDVRELPEGQGDAIGTPGPNDFGRVGWGGPCPPSGAHRYVFTLYALTEPIGEVADADALRARAGEGRTLALATLTGVYSRR